MGDETRYCFSAVGDGDLIAVHSDVVAADPVRAWIAAGSAQKILSTTTRVDSAVNLQRQEPFLQATVEIMGVKTVNFR